MNRLAPAARQGFDSRAFCRSGAARLRRVDSLDPRLMKYRSPVVDDDRRQPAARVSRKQCAVALEQASDGVDARVHLGERCELAWPYRTCITVSYVPIDMVNDWRAGGCEFVEIGRDDGRVDVRVDRARKVITPPNAHPGGYGRWIGRNQADEVSNVSK